MPEITAWSPTEKIVGGSFVGVVTLTILDAALPMLATGRPLTPTLNVYSVPPALIGVAMAVLSSPESPAAPTMTTAANAVGVGAGMLLNPPATPSVIPLKSPGDCIPLTTNLSLTMNVFSP